MADVINLETGEMESTDSLVPEPIKAASVQSGQSIDLDTGEIVSDTEIQETEQESSFIDKAIGQAEAAITIGSGMLSEPIAGIAGIGGLLKDAGTAEANINAVREMLTFIPRTEEGMQALRNVQELVSPLVAGIQKTEETLGEAGFRSGGPVSAAAATTIPTAALSVLGFNPVRSSIGNLSKKLTSPSTKKILESATPDIEGLKGAARKIYNEIDDTGAVVKGSGVSRLYDDLSATIRKEGFNRRIHPKVSAALDEFEQVSGTNQSVSNLDTLRRVSQSAAKSIDPDEARLGSIMLDKIDDFMDGLNKSDFDNPPNIEIGNKFKDARQLWQRAKKSELLEDAFDKARNQASGFENGLRVQFRSILNNKKKIKGFTPEEIDAMRLVVRGGTAENIAKALGKFGFTEGQATNMLMGSVGVAGGAALGGAPGAVAVPLIGQLSRNLAQKMTRNNASMANQIVRAGKNGKEIAKIYFDNVPVDQRSAVELSELLTRADVDLARFKSLSKQLPPETRKITGDAVYFASFMQSQKEESQ